MQDAKFRLFRRNEVYYSEEVQTGRQTSLKTKSKEEAKMMLAATIQAARQPYLNLAMAKVYLAGSRPELLTRTWLDVAKEIEAGYEGPTQRRWQKFTASGPVKPLLGVLVIQTLSEDFLKALRHPKAGVSTNVWLRILHNRAADLGWLLHPVMTRRTWPRLNYKKRRAITPEEHERILTAEHLPEYQNYYLLLWELGASQTDVARLHSQDFDHSEKRIIFQRQKLKTKGKGITVAMMGRRIEEILRQLPTGGFLFPNLSKMREDTRASHFAKVCKRAGIEGVTLHSYRYAWAVRAKKAGMPLREAMSHLGHGSKAVHNAYAAEISGSTLPLEFYEMQMEEKVIQFKKATY